MADATQQEPCNEVVLVGRVAAPAEERTLPSGDVRVTWRLVVDRPPARRAAREGIRPVVVDTIDCVAWSAQVRRTAGGFVPGDVAQVQGALRRRFWRGSAGPVSRCEVEVAVARRVARAQSSR
jgi:single-strand DNA-binding protein